AQSQILALRLRSPVEEPLTDTGPTIARSVATGPCTSNFMRLASTVGGPIKVTVWMDHPAWRVIGCTGKVLTNGDRMSVPVPCIATVTPACNASVRFSGPAMCTRPGKRCRRTCPLPLTQGFPEFLIGALISVGLCQQRNTPASYMFVGFSLARFVRCFGPTDAPGIYVYPGVGTPASWDQAKWLTTPAGRGDPGGAGCAMPKWKP